MAFLAGLPSAVPTPRRSTYPSGRYTRTNPLRREHGLRVLSEYLPEALRWVLIRAWRRPGAYSHPAYTPELPSPHRQRPDAASLWGIPPHILVYKTLTELEMARRLVEAPQASIQPVLRNTMLSSQSVYLRRLYDALAEQVGEDAALAEFAGLLLAVG